MFVFCDMGERVWVCGTGDCVLELELRLAVALPAWILSPWIERAKHPCKASGWSSSTIVVEIHMWKLEGIFIGSNGLMIGTKQ